MRPIAIICKDQEAAGKRAFAVLWKLGDIDECEHGEGVQDTRAWATAVYDPDVFVFYTHPEDGRVAVEILDKSLRPKDSVELDESWFAEPKSPVVRD